MSFSTPLRRTIAVLLVAVLLPASSATALSGCGDDTKASKTEIALRLGLAYGAFKRYIYTPAREGKFKKGADGRKRAIAKAALAGAFTARMLQKAKEEAEQDPELARLVRRITATAASVGGLTAILKGGDVDLSAITGGFGSLGSLIDLAQGEGVDVKEEDVSATDLLR